MKISATNIYAFMAGASKRLQQIDQIMNVGLRPRFYIYTRGGPGRLAPLYIHGLALRRASEKYYYWGANLKSSSFVVLDTILVIVFVQ